MDTQNKVLIDDFSGKYDFLSNFYATPIHFDGQVYPSAEHAYQASKTSDSRQKEAIRNAASPGIAKRLGRRATMKKSFDDTKIGTMFDIVMAKFSSNTFLASKLLSTGNAELVEGNRWGDTFWGVSGGVGENNLGKILMEIRSIMNDAWKDGGGTRD